MMDEALTIKPELLELLPDGLPKVSRLDEFLRIMELPDTEDNWVTWTRVVFLLMSKEVNHGKA